MRGEGGASPTFDYSSESVKLIQETILETMYMDVYRFGGLLKSPCQNFFWL